MLDSPSHVVVGCSDLEAMEAFLGHFGFISSAAPELPADAASALYGLDRPARQRLLSTPGAEQGWVRLVATPHAARSFEPYDPRPVAIDLYTRDIHQSLEISRQAGAHCGELVEYELGPLEIQEVEVVGPDQLVVVFIRANQRRPSVLDHDPDRLHSEVHSVVHAVADADVAMPFWTEAGGLTTLIDARIEGPIISQLMALPRPNVPVRFILMCDAEVRPARLELLQFFEDPGTALPNWPLAAGLHGPCFAVEDLDAAIATLPAEFGNIVCVGTQRGVSAVAPGGVRFELWST
ncbi:MAG: hypothetical protein AAF560_30235 [Acidobacteriota bacterium]